MTHRYDEQSLPHRIVAPEWDPRTLPITLTMTVGNLTLPVPDGDCPQENTARTARNVSARRAGDAPNDAPPATSLNRREA